MSPDQVFGAVGKPAKVSQMRETGPAAPLA